MLGNVGTIVSFRVGSDDAAILSKELDVKNEAALTDTPNYQAWVRFLEDGAPTSPKVIETTLPPPPLGSLERVVNRTRTRYARRKTDVDAHIERFLKDNT
jgi:hypothetical protein